MSGDVGGTPAGRGTAASGAAANRHRDRAGPTPVEPTNPATSNWCDDKGNRTRIAYLGTRGSCGRADVVGVRDHRIDFFRGFALYMILVDHIVGDPLARLTWRHLGLSDAAEVFVYLSGLVCGIAYSRFLARNGWGSLIVAIAKRATRIYLYYAASSGAAILVVVMAASLWNIDPHSDGLAMQGDLPTALRTALLLGSSPAHSGVLVLYILLTLVVIPMFLICGERRAYIALAASGTVWLFSEPLFELSGLVDDWYFNPFAWQLLFAIGMFFGTKWDCPQPALQRLGRLRWLIPVAWTIVAAALAYKLVIFASPYLGADATSIRIAPATFVDMKRNLSVVRLCHFLSAALLVATYFRSTNALLRTPVATLVIWSGMNSLQVFSLTVVLSALENVGVLSFHPDLWLRLAMDAFAFSLMALTAYAMSRQTRTAR
jgi:hypothetical protein